MILEELDKKEQGLINSLRMVIVNSIQDFKELNLNDLDDKYFLELTRAALIQSLQTCDFILDNHQLYRDFYGSKILNT